MNKTWCNSGASSQCEGGLALLAKNKLRGKMVIILTVIWN